MYFLQQRIFLIFLFPVLLLFVIPIGCMDTMETSVPGAEDSSHRFDAKDYKIIHGLPDSTGFRIKSIKVNEKSTDRLVLDIELSKNSNEYNFPIVYGGKNYYGTTIKPTQISVQETGKTDSLLNKRLKYSIYEFMSEYSRVYMKLPDQDSVLLELPVRWHPRDQYR